MKLTHTKILMQEPGRDCLCEHISLLKDGSILPDGRAVRGQLLKLIFAHHPESTMNTNVHGTTPVMKMTKNSVTITH
jgi:hypothetical protein